MADYYVASAGSNTAPYDTWAKAATTPATVLAVPPTAGDRIFVNQETFNVSASPTYTIPAGVQLLGSNDTSNAPPLTEGVFTINQSDAGGDFLIRNNGLVRNLKWTPNSTGACLFTFGQDDDAGVYELIQVDLSSNNNNGSGVVIGQNSGTPNQWTRTRGCTFTWGATGQGFVLNNFWESEGDDWCGGATVPSALFEVIQAAARLKARGCDAGDIAGTLFANTPSGYYLAELSQCRLNAAVTIQGAASDNDDGGDVFLYDCASGDTHVNIAHYNPRGSTVVSTTVYATTGDSGEPSGLSWLVSSSSLATFERPYISPWIEAQNTGTSAVTPWLECVRSGSATPYTDGQVWANWSAKVTASSTRATTDSDRRGVLASAANQAASSLGASDWTGENATSNFMKLGPGSSFTPAEAGHIGFRVVIGQASVTDLYVHPFIRGL